jgi:hypothetical protein
MTIKGPAMTIVHPRYTCAECGTADVPLYHFGRDDGHNVQIAHRCEHYIRDCYPGNPPPREWLEEGAVTSGADCILAGETQ